MCDWAEYWHYVIGLCTNHYGHQVIPRNHNVCVIWKEDVFQGFGDVTHDSNRHVK